MEILELLGLLAVAWFGIGAAATLTFCLNWGVPPRVWMWLSGPWLLSCMLSGRTAAGVAVPGIAPRAASEEPNIEPLSDALALEADWAAVASHMLVALRELLDPALTPGLEPPSLPELTPARREAFLLRALAAAELPQRELATHLWPLLSDVAEAAPAALPWVLDRSERVQRLAHDRDRARYAGPRRGRPRSDLAQQLTQPPTWLPRLVRR